MMKSPNPANINLEFFSSNNLQKCFLSFSNFLFAFPPRKYAVKFYFFYSGIQLTVAEVSCTLSNENKLSLTS